MREIQISGSTIQVSQSVKAVMAAVNWVVALAIAVAASVGPVPHVVMLWAVICALWGSTFVGWALIVRERLTLERLADIMAEELARQESPDRLRSIH